MNPPEWLRNYKGPATDFRAIVGVDPDSVEEDGTFEAVILQYGVIDDHGTIFDPGCFRESLERRLPRITRSHDWDNVVGHAVDYVDGPEKLRMVGRLNLEFVNVPTPDGKAIMSRFPAVPDAHKTHVQLKSGTLDQFSVGFRRGETAKDDEDVLHFRSGAILDEFSVVLSASNPGTELLSVRSAAAVSLRSTRAYRDATRNLPQPLRDEILDWAIDEKVPESVALAMLEAAGAVDLSGMAPAPEALDDVIDPGDAVLDAAADDALEALGMG